MKVYIVSWFSAEQYTSYSGVHSVFSTLDAAEKFIESMGKGPHESDPENFDEGYFLHSRVEEYEVKR